MKSWLVRFLGIRKKIPSSLEPAVGAPGVGDSNVTLMTSSKFQFLNARRFPSTFSSFRHGGTPPPSAVGFFYPSTKTQPPSRGKKSREWPAFREDLKVDLKMSHWKFCFGRLKSFIVQKSPGLSSPTPYWSKNYPMGIIGWVRNHVDRISPGKSFFQKKKSRCKGRETISQKVYPKSPSLKLTAPQKSPS